MTTEQFLAGNDLLAWRRRQLRRGGRSVDLDWLLDLGGGVSWSELQRLLLDAEKVVAIDQPLEALEKLWVLHLEQSMPLQHLVGVCPWRDVLLEVSSAALIPSTRNRAFGGVGFGVCGGTIPSLLGRLGDGIRGCGRQLVPCMARVRGARRGLECCCVGSS